jgi:hypothetical protein
MFHAHGTAIIATDIFAEAAYNYTTVVSFFVSTKSVMPEKMSRFLLKLTVPNTKLEEAKSKIGVGRVVHITNAIIDEGYFMPEYKNADDIRYSKVGIKCNYDEINFLKHCLFDEGIPGITEERK